MLLLRKAIAGVRSEGGSVALLAPRGPASLLHASGDVDTFWAYEEAAPLFSPVLAEPWVTRLRSCARARLYSRSPELAAALGAFIPLVEAIDPLPRSGHAADWYAQGLGEAAPSPLAARPGDRTALGPLASLRPGFVALHPGSGSPTKNWPFFEQLAREIRRPFLVVEGPADREAAAPVLRVDGARVARDLPLHLLGGLLARAGLLVANDSGVAHLAAAFGTPVLALFGPTTADRWAPPGAHTLSAPDGDLARLSVETVLEAVRGRLRSGAPRRPAG